MGRRKLPLELIPNEKARRITYEKRKKSIMKKAQEFTTLCGVDTCMIIYCPERSAARATEPEVWPANREKVKRIIERYMSEGADRRAKKTVGLPDFFVNRKRKVNTELAKARLANWKAEYPISKALIEGLSKEDLKRLLGSLGHKLEVAKVRLAVLKEDAMRRSLSPTYDHHAHVNDHMYHHHHMHASFQDDCHFGDVPLGQDFHFAIPEGMILLETSSYGPIMGNVPLEGTPSFGTCYDELMVQPASLLVPLSMMQASSRGDFQFHDYH
ncbi:agamous-like MADS-box protein AGL82 [Syzygium oleosum]|uniref:agamous-like MADS-box protein AGL82 n=1 Tax=Syzygium oleosum TaxID=219896 RepID=UPI0024BB3367|nr:agamous-like MADS-box protein AGL82 [Syzygium oleosum]